MAAPLASVKAWAATAMVPRMASGSCVPEAIMARSLARMISAASWRANFRQRSRSGPRANPGPGGFGRRMELTGGRGAIFYNLLRTA